MLFHGTKDADTLKSGLGMAASKLGGSGGVFKVRASVGNSDLGTATCLLSASQLVDANIMRELPGYRPWLQIGPK